MKKMFKKVSAAAMSAALVLGNGVMLSAYAADGEQAAAETTTVAAVVAEAATTAGNATTAEALTEAYGTLNAAIAGLNSDEHVIDNLEALDDAIDYEIE